MSLFGGLREEEFIKKRKGSTYVMIMMKMILTVMVIKNTMT